MKHVALYCIALDSMDGMEWNWMAWIGMESMRREWTGFDWIHMDGNELNKQGIEQIWFRDCDFAFIIGSEYLPFNMEHLIFDL
jgi:hypothetical protein